MAHSANLTALLVAWGKGDNGALEQLVPLVERELHRIAKRCMAGYAVRSEMQASTRRTEID